MSFLSRLKFLLSWIHWREGCKIVTKVPREKQPFPEWNTAGAKLALPTNDLISEQGRKEGTENRALRGEREGAFKTYVQGPITERNARTLTEHVIIHKERSSLPTTRCRNLFNTRITNMIIGIPLPSTSDHVRGRVLIYRVNGVCWI